MRDIAAELDAIYCRTAEAARILGVAEDTVKRLTRQRQIPGRHFGNGFIFDRAELRAIRAEHGAWHAGRECDPNSLSGRARTAGLLPETVRYRLQRGWTLQQALTVVPKVRMRRPCSCGHGAGVHNHTNRRHEPSRYFGCRHCDCRRYSLADVARRDAAEPTTNGSDHATVGGPVPLADGSAQQVVVPPHLSAAAS